MRTLRTLVTGFAISAIVIISCAVPAYGNGITAKLCLNLVVSGIKYGTACSSIYYYTGTTYISAHADVTSTSGLPIRLTRVAIVRTCLACGTSYAIADNSLGLISTGSTVEAQGTKALMNCGNAGIYFTAWVWGTWSVGSKVYSYGAPSSKYAYCAT